MARKPSNPTISDDLLYNALALTQQPISRYEVAPGYVEYYLPCQSGKHASHTVTVTEGRVVSDTPACGIDKYILASIGRPALHAIYQLRFVANDTADLNEILDVYAPEIRPPPESLKSLVRREIHRQREHLHRSGAMARETAQAA